MKVNVKSKTKTTVVISLTEVEAGHLSAILNLSHHLWAVHARRDPDNYTYSIEETSQKLVDELGDAGIDMSVSEDNQAQHADDETF